MANSNTKIICVGAATQDVFVTGEALAAKRDVRTHDYVEQFPLGAKLELDSVHFDTGGGGHNGAVTFARHGFDVSFAGRVGHDPAGAEVARVLHKEGIATNHLTYDDKLKTAYSVLLLAPNGERTVLSYRGASHNLKTDDLGIPHWEADWIYVASMAGNMDLLARILERASAIGAKVALNPGARELAEKSHLLRLLPYIEVLLGNRQELGQLFGGEEPRQIMQRADGICPYIVLTDGPEGTYISHADQLQFAGLYQKVKVVDRTGAGDAFNSGFVGVLAAGGDIAAAVTFGAANATSVVRAVGAKSGILRRMNMHAMKLEVLR